MLTEGRFPTEHTAGAFLDALKLDGQTDRCFTVFCEMMENGVDLGVVCFNIVVSALVQVENLLIWINPTSFVHSSEIKLKNS